MKQIAIVFAAAIAVAAIATAFIARKNSCTGNTLQDNWTACSYSLGDQK